MMPTSSPFENIRLVLFDLHGTLHKLHPTTVEAFAACCADLGLSLDASTRRAAVRWSCEHWATNRALIDADEKSLRPQDFIERHLRLFVSGLGLSGMITEDLVPQIVARFASDYSPRPYLEPGARELLARLQAVGLRLGLVSNRDHSLTDEAVGLGIDGYFDFMLSAGQVNSWKPDAGIYRHALGLAGGIRPEQAVHIGDNYYADVIGARGVGMRAILIDEEGAFAEMRDECLVITRLADLMTFLPDKPGSFE